jgi:CDP-diacylglycerol--serine O-phosphatidyltransferase
MGDRPGDLGESRRESPRGIDDRRAVSELRRRRRSLVSRRKVFAVLPTLLTLGNAACGFGAITYAARVGPDPAGEHFLFISAFLIFLAMLFDMLDGSVARLARQTSDFGAQLDSLCDAVSFGVAPAFLMLRLLHSMEADASGASLFEPSFQPFFEYPSRLLWAIACLFALCALLRLARFNVETDEEDSHTFFSGLPSPAAAATIASFPIALMGLRSRALAAEGAWNAMAKWLIPTTYLLLPAITLAVAVLMVSRFRYAHFFNQLFRGHRSRLRLIQIIFTLAIVFVVREAMPLIFCFFAFTPPAQSAWREITGRGTKRRSGLSEARATGASEEIEEPTHR